MRLRRPRGAMENPLKEHLSQLYCAPRQACPPHQRHYNCRPDPETRYQLTQPTITHENSKVGGNPEDPQAAAKAPLGPASCGARGLWGRFERRIEESEGECK